MRNCDRRNRDLQASLPRAAQVHDVTVFEAGDRPGGHTNTVRVDLGDETHEVDTGFIVFNEPNYPRFTTARRAQIETTMTR